VLAAERFGKHKTISQIVAIISILVLHCYRQDGPLVEMLFGFSVFGQPWVVLFTPLAVGVAVLLTLASGVIYLWRNSSLYLSDL
jgi:phosphatidylglycerophosphate synthase